MVTWLDQWLQIAIKWHYIFFRTPLGRARAWLRLALMQKTLADYFKVLIEKKDEVLKWVLVDTCSQLGNFVILSYFLLLGSMVKCHIWFLDFKKVWKVKVHVYKLLMSILEKC